MVLKYGIEIEAFANKRVLYKDLGVPKMNIQPYHRGEYGHMEQLPSWRFETDSSLVPTDNEFEYTEKEVFEAVTRPFKLNQWPDVFNEFKDYFTAGTKIEFNKVLAVNSSCGCHIHFSSTTNSHKTFVSYQYLKKIRNAVDEYIRINHPDIHKEYIKAYKRNGAHGDSYCREVQENLVDYNDRRVEWNMTALEHKKRGGIEWRAFNLAGIKTWEELNDILVNSFRIIEEIVRDYERCSRRETIEVVVPKKKIENIYDLVVL